MAKVRVGINGVGRIGRAVFRHILARPDTEVVAINDLGNNPGNLCYMLKYDSIHGTLKERIELRERAASEKDWTVSEVLLEGRPISVFSEDRIENVPWNELGATIVIDATGNRRNLMHAKQVLGPCVQRVIVTNSPDQHVDFTFVFDVTDSLYNPGAHRVIAASICDAIGLAPVIRRIESQYGVAAGFVTTLHPWLGYQNLLDGKPSALEFKERPDLYDASTFDVMGRASAGALIPKSTSAVSAIEKVLPTVRGKLNGMSFRVPTDVVGCAVVTLQLAGTARTDQVKEYLRASVREPYFSYTEAPLISVDYKHCESSCVIDGKWIEVLPGNLLRLVSWYDNEWGYSARVVDIAEHVCRLGEGRKP
jgi:glyceraldehyde 3-phosphate dehydrogenase